MSYTLGHIKTESLMEELLNRCGDQLGDPEPQYDGILSFLTNDELDWLMGELSEGLTKSKERASSGVMR